MDGNTKHTSYRVQTKKDTLQTLLPPLVKAEHIMYEYPDSALNILQEMQMPASSDKLQNATWALLLTQAKYKNYIEEVTDSTLINIAYDYFMKKGNAQRKAMTLYYKGVLYMEKQIKRKKRKNPI